MPIKRAWTQPFSSSVDDLTSYHDLYVVVYDFSEPNEAATNEFINLIKDLKSVGLHTEVRSGYDQSLLIFVQAPKGLLGNTVHHARVKDWLYGISKQHPGGTKDSIVDGAFEAENILSVHHLVCLRKELGGAGITPGFGRWENVNAVFPLHNDTANQRQLLHLSKKFFLSAEDYDGIRDIWGTKVAFYFAFIQTYFIFLTFPCIAGILAWLFLPKYSLSFAIIICVWSTVFLEYWKLQETDLSIRWNVRGVSNLKVDRPQFRYEKRVINATGQVQHYFPKWKHIARQSIMIPFVLLSTIVLGIMIAGVFALEVFISEAYEGPYKFYYEYLPTILLAMVLPYISNLLERVASALTEYENHRTQDSHEMSLTQKVFALNFITNYVPIFLTAFAYVPFGHIVIPRLHAFLYRGLRPNSEGKLLFVSDPNKLRNEVIALTVTGQIWSALEELVIPYLKNRLREWWRDRQSEKRDSYIKTHDDPSEQHFLRRARKQSLLPAYNVQEDISEMVIQFGYLALFSPVWPLIPIGFLINNWFELRSDFLKICIEHQRPDPVRSQGLGPWIGSLEALTWLGSISTAAIVHLFGNHQHVIGFIHSTMGRWYSLPITIFVSEHVFMALRVGVRFILREIGSQQIRRERREQYLERKKYLEELESSEMKLGHLNVKERERRKSIRLTGRDEFWTRQVDDEASIEAGIEIIKAFRKDCEGSFHDWKLDKED